MDPPHQLGGKCCRYYSCFVESLCLYPGKSLLGYVQINKEHCSCYVVQVVWIQQLIFVLLFAVSSWAGVSVSLPLQGETSEEEKKLFRGLAHNPVSGFQQFCAVSLQYCSWNFFAGFVGASWTFVIRHRAISADRSSFSISHLSVRRTKEVVTSRLHQQEQPSTPFAHCCCCCCCCCNSIYFNPTAVSF